MKKSLLIVAALFAGFTAQAQLTNLDFEGPDVNNALIGDQPDGWLVVFGTKLTSGTYQGSKSWKATTTTNATIAGIIGWPSNDVPGIFQQEYAGPVTNVATSVDIYFKYTSVSTDTGAFIVNYVDTMAAGSSDDVVTDQGFSQFLVTQNTSWVARNIPVNNFNSGTINYVLLTGYSSSGGDNFQDHPGSELFLDAIVFNFPNGVSESINGEVKPALVFPNPAESMVTFAAAEQSKTVEIFDIAGKMVASMSLNRGFNQMNVADFENGTYIYVVRDIENNVLLTEKLVIAK